MHTAQIMACFVGDDHRQEFGEEICTRNITGYRNQSRIRRVGDENIEHHQCAFFAGEIPHVDRLSDPQKSGSWIEPDFRLRTADEHSGNIRLTPNIRRVIA